MAYKFNPLTGKLDEYGPILTGTGTVSAAADGTAALPGIAFANDLNTGIYRPGADQVAISTGGTGRLFIDASGTVNIGTSANPTAGTFPRPCFYIKQLSDPVGGFGGVHVEASGEQSVLGIGYDGTAQAFTFDASYRGTGAFRPIAFRIGNTERLRITSAGLVGIGTVSPLRALTVVGSGYTGIINVSDTSGGTAWGMLSLGAHGTAANDTAVWRGGANSVNTGGNFLNLGSRDGIVFAVSNADAGSQTERVRIDSSGRVGIGTPSPLFPLDVNGVIYTRGRGSTFGVLFDDWRIYNSTAPGALVFDNGSERARIDSSGRLLVGTVNSPNADTNCKLLTNGNSTEIRLANIPGNPRLEIIRQQVLTGGGDIGTIQWKAYDSGTTERIGAEVLCQTDGNWASGSCPSKLVFSTTANGAASPQERLRITSTGQVRLAGAGITFNGDTATANELDDYEEGTFTPTISFATAGDLAVTYSRNLGRYTKIGNLVTVNISIETSAFTHTTASGIVRITGLPFNPNITNLFSGNGLGEFRGITKTGYTHFGITWSVGSPSISVAASASGSIDSLVSAADMPTGGTVKFAISASYPVA